MADVTVQPRGHLAIGRQWKSRSVLLLPHFYKEKVYILYCTTTGSHSDWIFFLYSLSISYNWRVCVCVCSVGVGRVDGRWLFKTVDDGLLEVIIGVVFICIFIRWPAASACVFAVAWRSFVNLIGRFSFFYSFQNGDDSTTGLCALSIETTVDNRSLSRLFNWILENLFKIHLKSK